MAEEMYRQADKNLAENSVDLPDDYIEIKAELFRVMRANSDKRSAKKVMEAIKEHLPDIDPEVIRQALCDLYT